MDGGFIYLICDYTRDYTYKIGVATGTVEKRIKELQTGNSGELIPLKTYWSEDPFYLETQLHLYFRSKKIMNEWFELTDDDVKKFLDVCKMIENNAKALEDNPFFRKRKKKKKKC